MLQGMGKGGFSGMGALSLPLMCLVISPVQAAAIQLPILMAQDIVGLWAYRRNMDKRTFLYCLPGTMIGIAIATYFAARVTPEFVQLMVGIIAAGFVLVSLPRAGDKAIEQNIGKATGCSSVAGVTSFIANAGGPPMQIYLMPLKLPPAVYAGTMVALFFIVNWVKFIAFGALGQISVGNLTTSAVLLPVAIGATFIGVWLVKRISGARFYPIIRTLTCLVGVKLIWDGANGLLRG